MNYKEELIKQRDKYYPDMNLVDYIALVALQNLRQEQDKEKK